MVRMRIRVYTLLSIDLLDIVVLIVGHHLIQPPQEDNDRLRRAAVGHLNNAIAVPGEIDNYSQRG